MGKYFMAEKVRRCDLQFWESGAGIDKKSPPTLFRQAGSFTNTNFLRTIAVRNEGQVVPSFLGQGCSKN